MCTRPRSTFSISSFNMSPIVTDRGQSLPIALNNDILFLSFWFVVVYVVVKERPFRRFRLIGRDTHLATEELL